MDLGAPGRRRVVGRLRVRVHDFDRHADLPLEPAPRRALTEVAKVPNVSTNELGRHSAASLLHDAGVPLEVIADLLGHASTRMLEQHYRHRVRATMSAHVAPMEHLFGSD